MTKNEDSKVDNKKSRQSYYLSSKLIKKVQIISDVEGWSQNEIVTEALEAYIERLEKKLGKPFPEQRPKERKGPPRL